MLLSSAHLVRWGALFALIATFGLASSATATEFYADQNGSTFAFTNMQETTTTAGDIEPLWEAPTIIGDTLIFTPSAFTSTSGGGTTDQTNSTFELDISSLNPLADAIDRLLVNEIGDYSLTGAGTNATSASVLAGAFLVVTEVNVGGTLMPSVITASATDFASFDTPVEAGDWALSIDVNVQALVDLNFSDAYATAVSVVWNNDLSTTSEASSNSQIQKKIGFPSVTMQVIPEPGTALLLGLGLAGLAGARRQD